MGAPVMGDSWDVVEMATLQKMDEDSDLSQLEGDSMEELEVEDPVSGPSMAKVLAGTCHGAKGEPPPCRGGEVLALSGGLCAPVSIASTSGTMPLWCFGVPHTELLDDASSLP